MPSFYVDDLDISVHEFINACSLRERNDLIDFLSKNGYIELKEYDTTRSRMSATEEIFEDHLDALHGKWNRLSKEDEETIMNIAKKFK